MISSHYRLIKRGALALAPIALLISMLEAFLWMAGETVPIRTVALDPLKAGYRSAYLPAFMGQQFSRFHYERMRHLRPELLVAGSSRVMRFRKEMFEPEARFYNSARLVTSVRHLEHYVAALPSDYAPDTLLIGVDSWWFNGKQSWDPDVVTAIQRDDTRGVTAHCHAYRAFLRSLFAGKVSAQLIYRVLLRKDDDIRRFGLLAWENSGIRNDGSYQEFGLLAPRETARRAQLVNIEDKILSKRGDVDLDLLARFVRALQVLEGRGTRIIGFAPPYSKEALRRFAVEPLQARYLADFRLRIPKTFREHGWPFLDGTDTSSVALDDRCMEDLHHPMETYLVAVLDHFARDSDTCRALHLDADYLASVLTDPDTNPWYPVYTNDPGHLAAK